MPPVPSEWVRNPSDELAAREGCTFDARKGEMACDFIESYCKQSKGKWAGQPLTLVAWQRDLIMRLFGWRKPDGRRRFRRCYCEVAKKNGKSTLVSGLVLLLLVCDDDGPEVYLNACDRDQASMIFDESARMVKASPALASRLEVINSRKTIVFAAKNGRIRANSSESPSKDGLNPSAVVFDELHRQPDRELWEVFEYAGAAREQPLTISITTAGESEEGVWFEQREYSEKVNRGESPDTTHLGVVYRALPDDDIDDPAVWRKANPSLGVTLKEEDFARELAEAKEQPVKLAGFKRLRLNIVARSTGLFIPPEAWARCDGAPRTLAELKGAPCWLGLDLSTTTDLTALVAIFRRPEGGYDVHPRFYLPGDDIVALGRAAKAPYVPWAEQGLLTLTPGNVIDYEFVRRDINRFAADFDLRKLGCDPFNATQLLTVLSETDGLPVEQIRQGFLTLSAPTKELARLATSGALRHGAHPILKWMNGNAVADEDAGACLKLSKRKSRQKIDGMAALVSALAVAAEDVEDGFSVYETRGLISI